MIGKTIGEGNMNLVKQYAKKMQKMFVVIGLVSALYCFSSAFRSLNCMNLRRPPGEMANTFLLILSVVIVGMSYQMPTNNGIIRGGGSPCLW